MLTIEILKGKGDIKVSEAIKALPDEVISEIAALSKNDEDVVIGNKIKEVHEKYDKDVTEATGLTKEHNERSWDFLKRGITHVKSNSGDADLAKKVKDLEADKAELDKMIKEGKGNEAINQQLKEATRELNDAKKELKDWKDKHKTDLEQAKKELETVKSSSEKILIEAEFGKARAGLKFKPEFPEEVVNDLVGSKVAALMSEVKVDWIDNGQGGKKMVFRDSNGEILRNKDNSLHPYEASDLLASRLGAILDTGAPKTGSGSQPPAGGGKTGGGGALRVQAANQGEAMTQIRDYLTGQGLKKGSDDWQAQQDKLWAENNCSQLPELT
jgi:hypothetical protein